ncbi:hypothetical protein ACFWWT_05415 [Streptomyces sp. NPDC058676]
MPRTDGPPGRRAQQPDKAHAVESVTKRFYDCAVIELPTRCQTTATC